MKLQHIIFPESWKDPERQDLQMFATWLFMLSKARKKHSRIFKERCIDTITTSCQVARFQRPPLFNLPSLEPTASTTDLIQVENTEFHVGARSQDHHKLLPRKYDKLQSSQGCVQWFCSSHSSWWYTVLARRWEQLWSCHCSSAEKQNPASSATGIRCEVLCGAGEI
eukprot:s5469_g5.t1